jgi:hypothetical protein
MVVIYTWISIEVINWLLLEVLTMHIYESFNLLVLVLYCFLCENCIQIDGQNQVLNRTLVSNLCIYYQRNNIYDH